MDMVTQVQILDEAYWILHSTNTLGKGMNYPVMGKYWGRLGSLAFIRQPVKEKEDSVKLHLKIDFVSHPANADRLVNTYIYIYIYKEVYFFSFCSFVYNFYLGWENICTHCKKNWI